MYYVQLTTADGGQIWQAVPHRRTGCRGAWQGTGRGRGDSFGIRRAAVQSNTPVATPIPRLFRFCFNIIHQSIRNLTQDGGLGVGQCWDMGVVRRREKRAEKSGCGVLYGIDIIEVRGCAYDGCELGCMDRAVHIVDGAGGLPGVWDSVGNVMDQWQAQEQEEKGETRKMTDRELRAAAIGVLVYEHLMQTGGAVIEQSAEGVLAVAADIEDGFMEYTLKVCSEVDLEAGSEFWMEGMGGWGRNLPRDLPRDN